MNRNSLKPHPISIPSIAEAWAAEDGFCLLPPGKSGLVLPYEPGDETPGWKAFVQFTRGRATVLKLN